jgi:serine/threonine-protein kinase
VTSDVFRLGAVLYRMLSGHSPFEGDDELSMAQRIRHEPAQPLARHMASAPSSVERLVGRCLSKRPRDRFPDTTSLAAELVRTLRTQTSLPLELLVSQALARAGVAEQLPAPEEQHVGEGTGLSQRLLGRGIAIAAVAAAAIVVALVAWQALRSPSAPGIIGARGVAQKPAELRVLARPWAEVHVDGNQVAITPIARPLPLGPGRHTVVFKHPNADDESREIEVIAGQTVLLDVQMKVRRPKVDAGPPDSGVIDP